MGKNYSSSLKTDDWLTSVMVNYLPLKHSPRSNEVLGWVHFSTLLSLEYLKPLLHSYIYSVFRTYDPLIVTALLDVLLPFVNSGQDSQTWKKKQNYFINNSSLNYKVELF